MKKEIETRILDIDKDSWHNTLTRNGFEYIGEFFQRRYVYDFNPVNPNKWIRLRTNGEECTITIKEIVDVNKVDGVNEWEIKVDDFDEASKILHELGFDYRNYQENIRHTYRKAGVEIVLDSWVGIPPFMEIEAENIEILDKTLSLLGIKSSDTTTLDVVSIYKKYGIDIKSIKELKFER